MLFGLMPPISPPISFGFMLCAAFFVGKGLGLIRKIGAKVGILWYNSSSPDARQADTPPWPKRPHRVACTLQCLLHILVANSTHEQSHTYECWSRLFSLWRVR